MKRLLKISLLTITILIFTSTIFGVGVMVGGTGLWFAPDSVQAADEPSEFRTFWQVWYLAQTRFVDRDALNTQDLTYGAIRGMIAALGDEGHTTFLTPEEVVRHRTDISGKFSGIGATLGMENGLPIIVAPFDGSPAAQAGVKAGDIIVEVDGEDVTTWSLNDIVENIRGQEGTEVTLNLFRDGEAIEVTIVRGEITVPTTTWAMIPGTNVALIRLSQFAANANDTMVEAITEARTEGATALILDVRSNPGGLLNQAVAVTSQFLKDGNVLQEEDADGNRRPFHVKQGGIATDIPLVVLTNRGSASSAEILAGAMQDHGRAPVVGETTFGTGTVLEPFTLDDGSELMLGTSQWLTANGRLIRKQGIEPDYLVELPIDAEWLTPYNVEELTVDEILESEDGQILKALELLEQLPEAR